MIKSEPLAVKARQQLCCPGDMGSLMLTAKIAVQAAENVLFRLPRRYRGSGAKMHQRIGHKTAAMVFGHDFIAGEVAVLQILF